MYRRAARSPRPAIRDPRPAQCPLSSALLCARGRCWAGGQATPSVRSPWLIRDRMRPRAQALLRDRTCSRSDPTSSTRASSAVRGSRGLTADQSRCRRALAIDPRRHTDVRGSCRSPDHALRVMITVTIADTHVGVQITDVFYLPRTHSLVRVRLARAGEDKFGAAFRLRFRTRILGGAVLRYTS